MSHKYFDLKEKGHRLCLEIEKLPASEQQTKVSQLASSLNKSLGCSSPGCGYPDGKPCLLCGLIVDKPDAPSAEQERDQLKVELQQAREAESFLKKYGYRLTDLLSEVWMFNGNPCGELRAILERIEKEKTSLD